MSQIFFTRTFSSAKRLVAEFCSWLQADSWPDSSSSSFRRLVRFWLSCGQGLKKKIFLVLNSGIGK
jgi:hypothetical protein